jgi:hypothetical protein
MKKGIYVDQQAARPTAILANEQQDSRTHAIPLVSAGRAQMGMWRDTTR